MPRFAANLSMLFTELPFLERFEAASGAGFDAVEYLFPYDYPADEIKQRLDAHNLEQVLFNAPPGDWSTGERGLACLPGREDEFAEGIEQAIAYAGVLGNLLIHVMAGIVGEGVSLEQAQARYIANMRYAAQQAGKQGLRLMIEPINNRDMPGYLVNYPNQAKMLIEEIGEGNVGLQLDLYHCQMMQGRVTQTMQELFMLTEHVQIAGVPGRHEPDVGELNYPYILKQLDELGYRGSVGCEYIPQGLTQSGLSWMDAYR
ncbi:2-oxo-tetronate isomerase [Marinobacterium lutimaris]|uniref:Hydroxypyruvate isomerase n=1 Tax=Marinobacterium lutimaris TaxID=568106 RepID=A0A1H6D210_9GAMM|nr:2-oxo-tetronate isomerase [Marinobacterium lutimaris]SEG79332.1 hydroxypyruvate isomerase [Marinobacterium lutimaris]